MNWITLTLLTALVEAIGNIFDRFAVKNEVKNTDTMVMLWGFAASILLTVPAILTGSVSVNYSAIGIGALAGFLYLFGWHFYYKGVEKAEVARVAPILSSIPLFVLIGSTIFLQEYHLPLQYLGMAIIFVGVLINAYDGQKHHLINHQAIIWTTLAAFYFATKNLLVKYLSLQNIEPLNVLFWIGVSVLFFNLIFACRVIRHTKVKNARAWGNLALAAFLEASGALLFTAAITIGPASLVSFLDRVTIFFVFIISEILDYFHPELLHEKFNKNAFFQKFIGVVIVLIGSYFLI